VSQRANYFKLGLFVIGAIAAGIIVLLIIGRASSCKNA